MFSRWTGRPRNTLRLLRSLQSILFARSYKHFVPAGLRCVRSHVWRLLWRQISVGFLFKRNPNRFFWRRLSPQGKSAAEEVLPDPGSKVEFMLPLDFGHFQQAVNQIRAVAIARKPRGRLVLSNIPALQLACAVHRSQPPRDMAQQAQDATNDRGAQFAPFVWRGGETGEHLADKFAVTPFIIFDGSDRGPFIRLTDRIPMAAIRHRRLPARLNTRVEAEGPAFGGCHSR